MLRLPWAYEARMLQAPWQQENERDRPLNRHKTRQLPAHSEIDTAATAAVRSRERSEDAAGVAAPERIQTGTKRGPAPRLTTLTGNRAVEDRISPLRPRTAYHGGIESRVLRTW